MKLLMISTDEKIFQTSSDVRERMLKCAKDLAELHIIIFTTQKFSKQQIATNCWIYPANSWSKWLNIFSAFNLGKKIIETNQVSEITCQDPFLTAIPAIWLKNKFHIPLEIQVHTDVGSKYFTYNFRNKIYKLLALNFLPKADKIRVVSEKIKSYLTERLKILEEKITVRPINVDLEKIRNAQITVDLHQKYPQFKKIILIASRLTKEKDIPTALRALKIVLEQRPDTGLVIVGSGPEKLNLAKTENIILEPWANQETLFSYYKTADAFLSTSLYEGYGLSMLEAHSAGLPVVATDAGIASELTNQVCSVGDEKCLAQELLKILS